MKLTQERIDYLLGWLEEADYCHLGKWGGDEAIDVQQDLDDALADIATLQQERDALVRYAKEFMRCSYEMHDVVSLEETITAYNNLHNAIEPTRKEIESYE